MPNLFRRIEHAIKWRVGEAVRAGVHGALAEILQIDRRQIYATERFKELIAKNPLLGPPVRHFSQNDEDGILLRILQRIQLTDPHTFLELGVGDGLVNSTLILLAMGWNGAWVGGEKLAFTPKGRLSFIRDWITRENVVDLASRALAPRTLGSVRVFSIDLDGNDFHIVSALLKVQFKPDVFVVEYNAKFPPQVDFVMTYNPDHRWTLDDYFGASLKAWCRLLEPAGYRLIVCTITGVSAFFAHEKHAELFKDVPTSIEDLYVEGRYLLLSHTGHPICVKTVEQIMK